MGFDEHRTRWPREERRSTAVCAVLSRPRVSSSASSTAGRRKSVWAMASCRCSPPDNSPARVSRRSASSGTSHRTCSSEAPKARRVRWVRYPPTRRFSTTVRSGKTGRAPLTKATPTAAPSSGRRAVISWPATSILPPAGVVSPATVLNRVDFPAPLAPTSATTSPLRTSIWTRSRTRSAPKSTVRDSSRSGAQWRRPTLRPADRVRGPDRADAPGLDGSQLQPVPVKARGDTGLLLLDELGRAAAGCGCAVSARRKRSSPRRPSARPMASASTSRSTRTLSSCAPALSAGTRCAFAAAPPVPAAARPGQ